MLGEVKRVVLKLPSLSREQRLAIIHAKTLRQFDADFFAAFSGFKDEVDYYNKASAEPLLASIAVPTLVIHSPDDPFVPAEAYERLRESGHPYIALIPNRPGGHTGFHDRQFKSASWQERAMLSYFEHLSSGKCKPCAGTTDDAKPESGQQKEREVA